MNLRNFTPENDLETIILQAREGVVTIETLLTKLAVFPLFISSTAEVQENGEGFIPLLLERGGKPLVATFSSLSRPASHQEVASYVLKMNGREFFLRLPPQYGVIVNPGYFAQLVMAPEAVANLRENLKSDRKPTLSE